MSSFFGKISKILFLCFSALPITISLIFHLLWQSVDKGSVKIPFLTMFLNTFAVPAYLVAIFGYFTLKHNVNLAISVPICFISAMSSIAIQYWNWGAWSGAFWNPDGATKIIYFFESIIAIIILSIGIGIISFIKSKNK